MLTLVHLSDIHFRRYSGKPYDIDDDLRNEVEQDAAQVAQNLGAPAAVLVGGDVAFSGNAGEYTIAREWLESFCQAVGVTFGSVWCVPGNHDVDQGVIKNSAVIFDLQDAIRREAPARRYEKLLAYMDDAVGREQLYRSIAAFNEFAEPYGFSFSADNPYCATDLPLNDGSILRVCGLNSTVVSNHMDQVLQSIILGRHQLPRSENGVTNLVLCHHPPDWWGDEEGLRDEFDARARIQLYGHKHRQGLRHEENSVKLIAGAVHPERTESDWRPRYNWLCVNVEGESAQRSLVVKVYPRVWSESSARFISDHNTCNGNEFKEFRLALDPWTPPPAPPGNETAPPEVSLEGGMPEPTRLTNPVRILTFRLFELPYLTRLRVAQDLNLISNEDAGLRDYEVFRNVLRRAAEWQQLDALWDAVQVETNDIRFAENPFLTRQREQS